MKTWKNKTKNYSLEDLLLDESFVQWVLDGKPADQSWEARLQDSPDLVPKALKAESLILQFDAVDIKEDTTRIDSLKKRIDYNLEGVWMMKNLNSYPSTRPMRRRYIWFAAASLTLLMVMGLVFRYYNLSILPLDTTVEAYEIRSTKNGQKLTVHLNDGSKVKLNSNSSIRYQKYFSDTSRMIYLEGEAFFEVARDSSRRFRVVAGQTITEALGTSFNIQSSDESTRIALVTGKVRVYSSVAEDDEVLSPGEMISSLAGRMGSVEKYTYEEIAWKDDVLLFNRCSRGEVFTRLEQWYGVKFKFEGSFGSVWNYSGKFSNQTLQAVLMSIGHTEQFEFEIQNKEVVIRPQ